MFTLRYERFAKQVACDDHLGPSESISKEKVAEEKNDKDDPTQPAKHKRYSFYHVATCTTFNISHVTTWFNLIYYLCSRGANAGKGNSTLKKTRQ